MRAIKFPWPFQITGVYTMEVVPCFAIQAQLWSRGGRCLKSCPDNLYTTDTAKRKRCTSLVCSCYVPPRNFNSRGEESNSAEKVSFSEKKEYGVMEEVSAYESVQDHRKSNGGRNSRSSGPSGSNNGPHLETSTLKSNLKKTASTTTIEENQAKTDHQKRKVSWPDIAYGTDIAHVLEFEPSISDDGEVEGVRNSCVCTIQ
ncbi:hypothetical protein OIU77_026667 [Salix suchowensis]|uniref:Uncharacterized protein n=1 Tax=Salix suchowensis TaxID=1278906 RepID=A0ABQ9BM60_9ROSI|nr:hypothetical protein OIU77_026667 [Salix suchowensis]